VGLAVAVMAALPFYYARAFAGDAQVHLVFAENAAHGQFFTFNRGETVAGETSPGYMMLGALLFRLLPAWAVPLAIKGLGILTWYALVWLVYRVAARALGDRRWALVAAIATGLMPGSAYNATVGMENGIFAMVVWLWLDLAGRWSWLTERASTVGRELCLAGLLVVACWLRPEGLVVAAAAWGYRLTCARPVKPAWVPELAATLTLGLGAVAFQYAVTGTLAATSILSRRLMAARESIPLGGPLFIDPRLALRLLAYLPLTGLYLVSRPASRARTAIERLGLVLLALFFVLFTVGTGAAHLARYMIFLFPFVTVGAARGARCLWEGQTGWTARRGRALVLIGACALAGVYAIEARERQGSYGRHQLRVAMHAVDTRTERTDELLDALGGRGATPAVVALESIEIRYELDDRIVVRSLDGRVDPELLRCVHRGVVDHICYLQRRAVEFLLQTPSYDRTPGAWTLARLSRLRPGMSAQHEGLVFSRLAMPGAFSVRPASP
jgi:hypothetical protein